MFWLILILFWLALIGWFWWQTRGQPTAGARHPDLIAGGLLALLTVGFFWRTISGDVYQPADGGDLASFLFPTYRFNAHQLSQGIFPLWNPHLYGGAPWISDIQAGLLYPPHLLLFWLQPDFAYPTMQWLVIAHLFWAGLGMYVLVRTLPWGNHAPLSRPAALFAALAFQFSDPLLIHFGNLNLIAVLSWLPWILAALARAQQRGDLRWAGVAGLLFAIANFAGHAQSSLYIGLALSGWTLFRLPSMIEAWRTMRQWRAFFPLLTLLVTLSISALLTASILLPTLELAQFTERSDFSYQAAVDFSLAPTQAIGLLTPGFFGHGPALHWGLWSRVETPFLGVATLILALAGLLLAPPTERRRLVPWLGLALFGLLIALGIYALLHGWLTVLLPGFGQLRAPARALVLWGVGLSILAAYGFDQIRAATQITPGGAVLQKLLQWGAFSLAGIFTPLLYVALLLTQHDPTAFLRASVAALAVTIAAAGWLATWALIAARRAGWINSTLFAGLMIALLYGDLAAAGAYTDISPEDPTRGYHHPEILAFLQHEPAIFRIDTDTGIADLWQPDTAILAGLEDIGGIANPLALRHWQELQQATGGRGTRLYDLLNVNYVIVRDGTPLPEGEFALAFDAPGELAVYRHETTLPRAWLVHEAEFAADSLARLSAPEFDPATRVVLEPASGDLQATAPANGAETVEITRRTANNLTVQVQASAPGYLVLSEVWYPGWQATVNGNATPVQRANHSLRAIHVPAGNLTVELWFAPISWRIGLVAGVVGLVLFAAVLLRGRHIRGADSHSPRPHP